MRELIVVALAVVGLIFSLSGALGIARMPDLYSRVQCSSKTITMGMVPAILAWSSAPASPPPTRVEGCWRHS